MTFIELLAMSPTPHHTELVGDVKELTSVPKHLGHCNYTVPGVVVWPAYRLHSQVCLGGERS